VLANFRIEKTFRKKQMALTRKREEPERPAELEDEKSPSGEGHDPSLAEEIAGAGTDEGGPSGEIGATIDGPDTSNLVLGEASPMDKEFSKLVDEAQNEGDVGPVQLGYKRFVYAAYFAGAIAVAFFIAKAGDAAWTRLGLWKPAFGEPQDVYVMPAAAFVGGLTAYYFWRDNRTRELAEEVAQELAKVTWPSKEQVTNGTAVVVVTTLFATLFFALMDRFWGFVTNLVYGS
jgi:preprotein translocase SecE subunit